MTTATCKTCGKFWDDASGAWNPDVYLDGDGYHCKRLPGCLWRKVVRWFGETLTA